MKPKITFILCIHNHQPVGNYEWVLKEVFEKCYEPFVSTLEEHPRVKVALHYSGPLLEWMPESFVERIRSLVKNGQVELLTSGFYEPIFPIIPFQDGVDQLVAYTNLLKEKFGRRPEGFWLAERVWEPNIPELAVQSGLRYTLIDDTHFLYAGLEEGELNGYYITEYQGSSIFVFPIAKKLRYLIPYEKPQETIDYLSSFPDGSILVYGDDGEKFGCWPGTYDLLWEEEWLERFFSTVEKTEWITLRLPSSVLANTSPRGRIYLPTASYDEMGEWALPQKRQLAYANLIQSLKKEGRYESMRGFLKGGYFRNFFTKYAEANQIHKKMIYVSKKVNEMRGKGKARAKRELWRGQGNCAYWHGVFGGLYLPHLREALYSHLISAEVIADKETRGREFLYSIEHDFDCDGYKEVLIETSLLNLYFHLVGGRMIELDYRPSSVNLLDTLTRQKEAYHSLLEMEQANSKEHASIHDLKRRPPKDFNKYLVYDRTTRNSLLDHLLVPDTTPQQFAEMAYSEVEDLSSSLYGSDLRRSQSDIQLELHRKSANSNITKTILITPKESTITIDYHLQVANSENILFGVEFNLNLSQPTLPRGLSKEIRVLAEDKRVAVSFELEHPADIWGHPINTLSQSESGYDLIYQGFCLMPVWKINAREFGVRIRLEVSTC